MEKEHKVTNKTSISENKSSTKSEGSKNRKVCFLSLLNFVSTYTNAQYSNRPPRLIPSALASLDFFSTVLLRNTNIFSYISLSTSSLLEGPQAVSSLPHRLASVTKKSPYQGKRCRVRLVWLAPTNYTS